MHASVSDTSDDAARVQVALLRRKTPSQRAEMALHLSAQLVHASKLAILRAHPDLTPWQVNLAFIELHYGRDLAVAVRQFAEGGRHGATQ